MASFSIHDLLGLNKGGQRNGEAGASFFKSPQKDSGRGEKSAEGDNQDHIDVESYDEDNSHQLVTVEVRTMRHASSMRRSSTSRKRKRTESAANREREVTPDTDGE